MDDFFSLAALLALMKLHYIITLSVLACVVLLTFVVCYWEQVAYFAMRVWHGVPLIGTVARLSKATNHIKDGWPSVEENLCRSYANEYFKYTGGSGIYLKSKNYLGKIGESGRRPMPLWVLALGFLLLILEAVGFAFVIGPWINPNVSATQVGYLAWAVAFFLALISGFFAHFAGHHMHYNSIVKKAHAWWSRDTKNPLRPSSLKELTAISIDDTYQDNDRPDYQQILARIDADSEVDQKKSTIYGFFLVILIFAVAAFWIRADTLKSIETDMVAELRGDASALEVFSPFDLPEESSLVNQEADDLRIEDKISAIRSASLMTYVVLSVVYVAIQVVMLWLSMKYGFVGNASKDAWENTHKFKTAEQYLDWLAAKRSQIVGHADHKLRLLQQKRASNHTAVADEQDALGTERVGARTFLAYIRLRNDELNSHNAYITSMPPIGATASALGETVLDSPGTVHVEPPLTQREVSINAPTESDAPNTEVDPLNYQDLTVLGSEELEDVAGAFAESLATLQMIRRKQLALKKIGKFPTANVQEIPA
ncbi:hypothetical protein [Halopseudomonas pelagia]|uniref:hypothetical protein n=1 Tax=Halopseudomonas pelagia TaxID=553151 RepID=UPI0003A72AD6|nr:hypothetical protein [Halopseudomonas pelagia]